MRIEVPTPSSLIKLESNMRKLLLATAAFAFVGAGSALADGKTVEFNLSSSLGKTCTIAADVHQPHCRTRWRPQARKATSRRTATSKPPT